MKRIVIVTDSWKEQINGVTRTLEHTVEQLRLKDFDVQVIDSSQFKTFSCPTYPQIPLSLDVWRVGKLIKSMAPDYLHIATEGTLGVAAKLWADRRKLHYTTSYHTNYPDYIRNYFGYGLAIGYKAMKWFHRRSCFVMVNTPAMMDLLTKHGMKRLSIWGRGVDTSVFRPDGEIPELLKSLPKPILMNVGRVAIEKNLEEFYNLSFEGSKVQVGDGPMLDEYKEKYPDVHFVGAKTGVDLASYYRGADVFVFPSLTDTYGLVLLESVASGVPVAAYPVTGPIDVITEGVGCMHEDLITAVRNALVLNTTKNELHEWAVREKSWSACTDQFISYLQPI